MGTISKYVAKNGDVTFQGKVRRKGFPSLTKTFHDKRDCEKWIRAQEAAFDRGEVPTAAKPRADGLNTLADVLRRYAEEVSPKKRGGDIELMTVRRWLRECREFVSTPLAQLDAAKVAAWRDGQMEGRAGSSVARQMNLLLAAVNLARAEWGCADIPTIKVARPKSPPHRDRILKPSEEKTLLAEANTSLRPVIVFALETAMRAGEIMNAKWTDIDWERRVIHLPRTKTDQPRDVPLSPKALAALESLPKDTGRVFASLTGETLKRQFIRLVKRCGIADFHFHDCRHTCLSRLAREKGWNPIQLATLSGHKDIRMLQRYVHLKADDLVAML
ncbi:tyrosine-type recombinase/integrase [Trinickia sp.]|uniref:tyrosine-type recombinase/integrase n=1 Tax=Trinickia sp. TaxID=2571163 RepID=UPI003F812857